MTNGRPCRSALGDHLVDDAPGACTTPASCTRCRAGARATSRSTTAGHVAVHPTKDPARAIDLKELVDRLAAPRHRPADPDPLHRHPQAPPRRDPRRLPDRPSRSTSTRAATAASIPIKVNQQRQVVEEVLDFGKPYDFGLEAGSKPELLAVVALTDNDTPIICNGFKDAEFIEMAMLAQQDRPQHHPGRREVHRAGADPRSTPRSSASGRRSACASSWPRAAAAAGSRRAATARSSA